MVMVDDYLSEELFPPYPLFVIIPGSGITILVSWQNISFLFFLQSMTPHDTIRIPIRSISRKGQEQIREYNL